MVLTEAYRYQNFLSGLYNKLNLILSSDGNIIETREIHKKKDTYSEAEDEEKVIKPCHSICENFGITELIMALCGVIAEKTNLTNAIATAKLNSDFDIDSEKIINSEKRDMLRLFDSLLDKEDRTFERQGQGYKFDVDGNQQTYWYEIEILQKLKYSKDDIKELKKNITKCVDEMSLKIAKAEMTLEIDYEPLFDMTDSLEDCLYKLRK